jgi:hypothetical protein
MATLHSLVAAGTLVSITVPLDSGELPERSIYGFPSFQHWLVNELPNLEPGRLKASESPQEQLDSMMYRWIAGKRIIYDRMFKDLMPMQDEVWEMKTVDIRVFGWIYRPLVFIAVFGDYTDRYKGKTSKASYETARQKVKESRDSLDIDEPKFTPGVFDDLIRV